MKKITKILDNSILYSNMYIQFEALETREDMLVENEHYGVSKNLKNIYNSM